MAIPQDATIKILAPLRSGKLGDAVHSRNQHGPYVRAVGNPIQPATAVQQSNWADHLSVVNEWQTLTDPEKLTWNTQTKNWKRINTFGSNKPLTGQALFIKLNRYLLTIRKPFIRTCPAPTAVKLFTSVIMVCEAIPPRMLLTVVPALPPGHSFTVYATPPLAPHITWYKNKLRFVYAFPYPPVPTVNLRPFYFTTFGVFPSAGDIIYFLIRPILNSSGRPGYPVVHRCETLP